MCKKPKGIHNRIDKCMKDYIKMVNSILLKIYETKASCCGHGRYQRTVIVGLKKGGDKCFELFTGKLINRKKKFYKKDEEGYYFIPETIEVEK